MRVGLIVPAEEAEEADEESSSERSMGSSENASVSSSSSSSSLKDSGKVGGKPASLALAKLLCNSLMEKEGPFPFSVLNLKYTESCIIEADS